MIVVEGPDGAGKTTLIKDLSKFLGLEVAPRVVSKEARAMTDLRVWTEQNLAKGFQKLIFDRHRMISELIYGPVLRGEAEAPFNDLIWLSGMYKRFYAIRPVVIYCLPPLGAVISNVMGDPDNEVVRHKIWSIYNMYVSQAARDWARDPARTVIYDYTRDGQEAFPMLMFDHINRILDQESSF